MIPTSPHDALFKCAFGQPEIARSELALVLPAEIRAHIDLATLQVCPGSFVDEELQQTHSDLLYAVRATTGGEALVYVLFEHQSSFDAQMPLRLLRYVVRVWERWLRDRGGLGRGLPIVLPVVLHHGDAGWRAAPELSMMIDASPALLEATRPYLPLFRFILDDLGALPLDALRSRTLHALAHLVQLAFWSSRSFERLSDAAPLMREITKSLSRDVRTRGLLEQLYVYLLRATQPDVDVVTVRTILLEVAGPEGQEDVMNAGEQLIEQGREQGLKRGLEQGLKRGLEQGLKRGLEQGLEQGRLEGLRSAIAAALGARGLPLSELGRARLESCPDVTTLTRWLARAVTAPSEDEVFTSPEAR